VARPLHERPTLHPRDEVRHRLRLEQLLLEDLDGERLDRLSRDVVIGTGSLAALASGKTAVDVPANRLGADVVLPAEAAYQNAGQQIGGTSAFGHTDLAQAPLHLRSDLGGINAGWACSLTVHSSTGQYFCRPTKPPRLPPTNPRSRSRSLVRP